MVTSASQNSFFEIGWRDPVKMGIIALQLNKRPNPLVLPRIWSKVQSDIKNPSWGRLIGRTGKLVRLAQAGVPWWAFCYHIINSPIRQQMNNQNESSESKAKHITLGFIISWIAGILFLILGISTMIKDSFIGGLSFLVASAVIMPPATTFIKNKFNFTLSGVLKFVVVIILLVIAFTTMKAPKSETPVSTGTDTTTATEKSADVVSAPSAKTYQQVFTFSGKGAKKSEPFTITGDRFKVKYDCVGDLCQAFLYKIGSSFTSGLIMNSQGSIKDETIFYGAGEYYIDANTIGSYTMTIEDYK